MSEWVFKLRPEHSDLIMVAQRFAEYVAAGDWNKALHDAQTAWDVSHGAYLFTDRNDGGCEAITRDAGYCPHAARPGSNVCGLHDRYIRANKADA